MINSFARKKISALYLVLVILTGLLTGCGGEQAAIVINEDGTCGYSIRYLFDKTIYRYKAIEEDFIDFQSGEENINGKDYYVFARDFSFSSCQEMHSFLTKSSVYQDTFSLGSKEPSAYEGMESLFASAVMDTSNFIGEMNSEGEFGLLMELTGGDSGEYQSLAEYYANQGIIMNISITFPASILESNGAVNGNTVTWDLSNSPIDGKLVASTSGNPISSDTIPPVIHLKDSKTGIYGPGVLKVTDDVCLKSITINDSPYNSNMISINRSGKYTVVATDANNNVSQASFRVDATPPKIKGAKYGKVYRRPVKLRFSDNTKIKSVKVNGKKRGNKKKLTLRKPGRYRVIVTDQLGNKSGVIFRIKKNKKK